MKELDKHQQEIETTRVGGFGGSDAALFLRIAKKGGVDGLSNTDLYRIAVAMGIKPYAPVPVTEAMQAGHIFEDSYACMLKDSGVNFEREVKIMPHKLQMHNFAIFAHADFILYTHEGRYYNSADYFDAVHECKFIADESKSADDVAETYKAQLQWYYMLGVEYVDLIRGYGDPTQPNIQRIAIEEDETIVEQLLQGIQLLDDAIEHGWAPEIEEEYASAMSEKMQNIIHDYETLKLQKSAIDDKLDELQKQIVEYMTIGNVAKINGTLGTISRTADSVVESFDSKKFEKENPEIYRNYIKKSTRKGSLRYTINK